MKRLLIVSALALLVLPASACNDILFEDPEHVYDGPPVVEFGPALPAGNYVRTITLSGAAPANQTTNVRVNYVAASPSSNVTGEIVRAGNSTAVEGTHYRFPGGSSWTIAAGTNSVDVPIEVLSAGFNAGQSVTLVLELAPGQGYGVNTKYRTFTLTLRRT